MRKGGREGRESGREGGMTVIHIELLEEMSLYLCT